MLIRNNVTIKKNNKFKKNNNNVPIKKKIRLMLPLYPIHVWQYGQHNESEGTYLMDPLGIPLAQHRCHQHPLVVGHHPLEVAPDQHHLQEQKQESPGEACGRKGV